MKAEQDPIIQTAIRLPESALARADKLAKTLTEPGRRCTRSDALRMALFEGLDTLESKTKKR